jgi:SRSO17 transposase
LPAIAKIVGLENPQALDYFIGQSPWAVKKLRKRRMELILKIINGEEIVVIIDEIEDRKKRKKTDYVKRQYIGNLGKIENGIVAVTAYGIFQEMTLPLLFEVYKPRERLKEGDEYKSKPEIGGELIEKLLELGFKIKLVLADSEYGESENNFVSILRKENLPYILAIRENHGVWLPAGEHVRANRWREFERVFASSEKETRYIREIILGKKREVRYWEITDDRENLPKNSTWYVMSKVEGIKYKEIGNLYELRNWIEYGLKQSKNELGWADFRLTEYSRIEKWCEIVMSVYLMVSLQTEALIKGESEKLARRKRLEKYLK